MTRFLLFLAVAIGFSTPLPAQQNWPYTPVARVPAPTVKDTSWCRNPLDRFVLAKLESHGLSPAKAASKETLLRRVYFDLIGLPPTPAERQTFLAD
ncbi:MAG: DUF1549 domain-containing protein, partial [Planctomycetota bacterium]|nr:DUF1549 domain-containing protein [Planctomycetota bacterium]